MRCRYRSKISTFISIISIIFIVLAGLSLVAWLLPSMFNSLGDWLVRITGSSDIRLNVQRIRQDSIGYTFIFSLLGLFMNWVGSKF